MLVFCNTVALLTDVLTLLVKIFSAASLSPVFVCHSGYVTVAALVAYQSFQLSLLLSILPSVINTDLYSSYPVLNLSTWYFSWSVWTLGTTVWVISGCLIFDVESLRKQDQASSRKGFLQLRHQQHPEYYTRNVRSEEWEWAWKWCQSDPLPRSVRISLTQKFWV